MTAFLDAEDRLDAYRFHEQSWEDYDELRDAFEWEVPETFNVATYVCDRWAGSGRIALIAETPEDTTEYAFADLRARADRFADYLREQGVERGDRVAVSGAQRVEGLVTHLACWKVGAVSMPLSVRFDPDELRYRLEDSEASAFVVTEDGLDAFRAIDADLPALDSRVVVEADPRDDETTFADAIEGRAGEVETAETAPDDPASVVYTSGTTGDPKGVVLPHQHLLGILPTALCGVFDLEIRDDDVLRTPVGWSWVGSFNFVVLAGLYYGRPVVAADTGPFHPKDELERLERQSVTLAGGPPTAFRFMFDYPTVETTDLSALRVVGFGGEAAGDAVVERAREVAPDDAAVHKVYGQAEAAGFVSHCEALGVDTETSDMGRPGPGHEIRVVDPDSLEPVETGELGELALRYEDNPMCFSGYRNAPEKTAEKVRDGWLLCEDVGRADDEGNLAFHSRKDDAIVSSGREVSPGAIEDELTRHDAVFDAGVVGLPDETRGERIKAFVSLSAVYDPEESLTTKLDRLRKLAMARVAFGEEYVTTAELRSKSRQFAAHAKAAALPWDEYDPAPAVGPDLRAFADRRLGDETPHEFEFVSELPKTNTRKVRRRDLREREGVAET